MKKKVLSYLLCGAMATSLTGCGSPSSDAVSSSANSDSAETSGAAEISGSLTIWEHSFSFEDSLVQIIEAFNKKYPNVEVNYEIKSDNYDTVLSTAIQSGDGPDLFWTNGTATTVMPDYVANNAVADLTDYVDYSFISESAMNMATINKHNYSVPWMTMDTRTVYYNKDMFAKNGWEIPKTFPEFEALLETIKKTGTTPISLALDPWCLLFAFEPVLSGYDADYSAALQEFTDVKATDEPVRGCMKKMVEWSEKGYFGDNWFGVIDNDSQTLAFTTGAAAMNITGSWNAATISSNNPDLNYGAFTIPSETGITGLVGTASNGFSVNAKSKNMDAAVAFANFCASKDAQTIWVQSQGAVSGSPQIEASTEIAREISASGGGNVYRSWQNILSSYSSTGKASTVWGDDFTKIFTGEMTVDEFCDEIQKEM